MDDIKDRDIEQAVQRIEWALFHISEASMIYATAAALLSGKTIEEIDKAYADAIERVNEIKQQLAGSGFGIDALQTTIN